MKTKWIVFWLIWCVFWFGFDAIASMHATGPKFWMYIAYLCIQLVCAFVWYFELRKKLAA